MTPEEQYKQETGKNALTFNGFSADYGEWLKHKLAYETARADKAESERDELIKTIKAVKNFHEKTGMFSWDDITAAINRIKGE